MTTETTPKRNKNAATVAVPANPILLPDGTPVNSAQDLTPDTAYTLFNVVGRGYFKLAASAKRLAKAFGEAGRVEDQTAAQSLYASISADFQRVAAWLEARSDLNTIARNSHTRMVISAESAAVIMRDGYTSKNAADQIVPASDG